MFNTMNDPPVLPWKWNASPFTSVDYIVKSCTLETALLFIFFLFFLLFWIRTDSLNLLSVWVRSLFHMSKRAKKPQKTKYKIFKSNKPPHTHTPRWGKQTKIDYQWGRGCYLSIYSSPSLELVHRMCNFHGTTELLYMSQIKGSTFQVHKSPGWSFLNYLRILYKKIAKFHVISSQLVKWTTQKHAKRSSYCPSFTITFYLIAKVRLFIFFSRCIFLNINWCEDFILNWIWLGCLFFFKPLVMSEWMGA